WWWQGRHSRNTFVLTLALAMSLGAVGSLLLAWRMLHLAFIWLAPILVLVALGWLTWKFWPRPRPAREISHGGLEPGIPPAMASIAVLLCCLGSAVAGRLTPALSPCDGKREKNGMISAPAHKKFVKTHVGVAHSEGTVSILSANYAGQVDEHVAQFDVVIRVSTSVPEQKLRLFGDDVTVREFSAKPVGATL